MKLLLISAAWPPAAAGDADQALQLCNHLTERGLEVIVLTTRRPIEVEPERATLHPLMRGWSWSDLPRFVRFLRRSAPDAILLHYSGHLYNEHPMVTLAPSIAKAVLPNVPFITQFGYFDGATPERLGIPARLIRKGLVTLFGSRHVDYRLGTLLRDSDSIIAFCESHRRMFQGWLPDAASKTRIIPPPPLIRMRTGFDSDARLVVRQALGIPADAFLLVYFGYAYRGKGIETLYAALHRLAALHPKVRLLMVSGGFPRAAPYAEELADLSQRLDLGERVVWSGRYPADSDLASSYLQAADAAVLPFDRGVEFHRSSLAAVAAHGLPIVTTQGPILEAPFQDGRNMLLCPPGDPIALSTALDRVITDDRLRSRLAAGARELAAEWFSWDSAVRRTLEALGVAVSGAAGSCLEAINGDSAG